MGMIYTKRMLVCCDVVAQCQVELIEISALSGDRCDRAVRCSVCLCKDESSLICITAPFIQDMLSEVDDTLCVSALKADD